MNNVEFLETEDQINAFYEAIQARKAFDTLMEEKYLQQLTSAQLQSLNFLTHVLLCERDMDSIQQSEIDNGGFLNATNI